MTTVIETCFPWQCINSAYFEFPPNNRSSPSLTRSRQIPNNNNNNNNKGSSDLCRPPRTGSMCCRKHLSDSNRGDWMWEWLAFCCPASHSYSIVDNFTAISGTTAWFLWMKDLLVTLLPLFAPLNRPSELNETNQGRKRERGEENENQHPPSLLQEDLSCYSSPTSI